MIYDAHDLLYGDHVKVDPANCTGQDPEVERFVRFVAGLDTSRWTKADATKRDAMICKYTQYCAYDALIVDQLLDFVVNLDTVRWSVSDARELNVRIRTCRESRRQQRERHINRIASSLGGVVGACKYPRPTLQPVARESRGSVLVKHPDGAYEDPSLLLCEKPLPTVVPDHRKTSELRVRRPISGGEVKDGLSQAEIIGLANFR